MKRNFRATGILALGLLTAGCMPESAVEGNRYTSSYLDQELAVCMDGKTHDIHTTLAPVDSIYGSNTASFEFVSVLPNREPPVSRADRTVTYTTSDTGTWAEGVHLSSYDTHTSTFANAEILAFSKGSSMDIDVSCGRRR